MARAFDKRTLALLSSLCVAIAIFVLDLATPPALAVWTLYMAPLLALYGWGRKADIYSAAVICAILIYLGLYLAPAEQSMPYALPNRLLEIAIVLVFAVAMGRRLDARRALLRQHSSLKRLLDERNRALEELMAQPQRTEAGS